MKVRLMSFDQLAKDRTSAFNKLDGESFLTTGKVPIIDQGKAVIAGYTNNENLAVSLGHPVVVFGDHTQIFKFVDHAFVLGADGTKVLEVDQALIDPLYFFHVVRTARLPDKGYSRYFKYLKKQSFSVPEDIEDQRRIAALLSRAEGLIAQRKESIRLLDELVRSVFLEMFGDPLRNEKGWAITPLAMLGTLERGVSKHRPRNAPELLDGEYPLVQTGDVSNAGLYLRHFTQTYSEIGLKQSRLWPSGTLCITIAANIAKSSILTFDACFPDSVVGFTPYPEEGNAVFVRYLLNCYQASLEKGAPQAAQKNINLNTLRTLHVPKPDHNLQLDFARSVEQVVQLEELFKDSLIDLEQLYGSLSQRAFRGELTEVAMSHAIL